MKLGLADLLMSAVSVWFTLKITLKLTVNDWNEV